MEQVVLDQLESLNPNHYDQVKTIIGSLYQSQEIANQTDPWLLSIIERVDLSKVTLSDHGMIDTIKTVLSNKLGKQYYDLLYIYLLEIGKQMAITPAGE